LQQILENEDFQRLPLPKDYDLLGGDTSASSGSSPASDNEGSLLKKYFNTNENLRGLEHFGSFLNVFSNNKNQNSAENFQEGILAQMAVSNPFKRVQFLSNQSSEVKMKLLEICQNFIKNQGLKE